MDRGGLLTKRTGNSITHGIRADGVSMTGDPLLGLEKASISSAQNTTCSDQIEVPSGSADERIRCPPGSAFKTIASELHRQLQLLLGDDLEKALSLLTPDNLSMATSGRTGYRKLHRMFQSNGVTIDLDQTARFLTFISRDKAQLTFNDHILEQLEKRERYQSLQALHQTLAYEIYQEINISGFAPPQTFNLSAANQDQFNSPAEMTSQAVSDWNPGEVHSQDQQLYSSRRLSAAVMNRAIEEDWTIEILGTHAVNALKYLYADGFTHLTRFYTQDGNYLKLIASNPDTNETKLVLQTAPGRSYLKQIEGSVMLYQDSAGRSVRPEKLRIWNTPPPNKEHYCDVLAAWGIEPDIVVIGNQKAVNKKLEKLGIKAVTISDPLFDGLVYRYTNGNVAETLLSVNISPKLFGDRSTAFVEAILSRGAKTLIFSGTAGGIDSAFQVGDVVIPGAMLRDGKVIPIVNRGEELMKSARYKNLQSGTINASVDSSVLETIPFIRSLQKEGVQTVECELVSIVAGMEAHGCPADFNFFAFLNVSDIPGSQYTNAKKNYNAYKGQFVKKATDEGNPEYAVPNSLLTTAVLESRFNELRNESGQSSLSEAVSITSKSDHHRKLTRTMESDSNAVYRVSNGSEPPFEVRVTFPRNLAEGMVNQTGAWKTFQAFVEKTLLNTSSPFAALSEIENFQLRYSDVTGLMPIVEFHTLQV